MTPEDLALILFAVVAYLAVVSVVASLVGRDGDCTLCDGDGVVPAGRNATACPECRGSGWTA